MKQFFFRSGILLALTTLSLFSCKKGMLEENVDSALPQEQPEASLVLSDYAKLADELEIRLKDNVVGYSFVISDKNSEKITRSGGKCRTNTDAPYGNMSAQKKYSIASVSKTITAAALLRAMADNNVKLDYQISQYLPWHWATGNNINYITFRDLLDHTSGLRDTLVDNNYCNYQGLKKVIGLGVKFTDRAMVSYNNQNYALMRLLIPQIAKYSITNWSNAYPIFMMPNVEGIQAKEYANGYKDYCRKKIFSKMSSTANVFVDCNNTDTYPGLYYPPPALIAGGLVVPDLTMKAGGEGWVLTTAQMADFMRTLHYTENILPKTTTDLMITDLLGYDVFSSVEGVGYWHKNGIYRSPAANGLNFGYRSLIIGFGDGINIAIMANSPRVLEWDAVNAYKDWHQ